MPRNEGKMHRCCKPKEKTSWEEAKLHPGAEWHFRTLCLGRCQSKWSAHCLGWKSEPPYFCNGAVAISYQWCNCWGRQNSQVRVTAQLRVQENISCQKMAPVCSHKGTSIWRGREKGLETALNSNISILLSSKSWSCSPSEPRSSLCCPCRAGR